MTAMSQRTTKESSFVLTPTTMEELPLHIVDEMEIILQFQWFGDNLIGEKTVTISLGKRQSDM
jgi:hypothetical protein